MTSDSSSNGAPDAPDDPPEGFLPMSGGSGFSNHLAPIYLRAVAGSGVVLGVRIGPRHLNLRGIAHGGMLATLADIALGMNIGRARRPSQPIVTVNLNCDYLDAARVGDWLEAHVTVRKQGRRLAFGECLLKVGERVVLRASAVFSVVGEPHPRAESDG